MTGNPTLFFCDTPDPHPRRIAVPTIYDWRSPVDLQGQSLDPYNQFLPSIPSFCQEFVLIKSLSYVAHPHPDKIPEGSFGQRGLLGDVSLLLLVPATPARSVGQATDSLSPRDTTLHIPPHIPRYTPETNIAQVSSPKDGEEDPVPVVCYLSCWSWRGSSQ